MSIDGSLSAAQAAAAGRIASAWAYGLDQAIQSAHEDYEHTITRGAVGHGLTALVLGELQLLVGVAEESIWSLREASITLRRAQPYLGRCLDGLAVALSLCGELDQAREVLKQRAAIVGPPADDLGAARAAAAVAAAGGDVGHALGILQDAGTQAARNRAHLEAVRIAHDLARIGDLRTARHLVTDEGTHVDGTVATLLCEHVLALCGRRPHPLQSVASQLAEAGLWRFAAEAELAAAERFANEGQRAAAGAASRRASALMCSCGPLHLGVEAPIPGQVGLTRREREIAELAAAGLRDLEISERLSVSVRTVQTHLQHAYCKLGVHSREALQAALSSTRPARRT